MPMRKVGRQLYIGDEGRLILFTLVAGGFIGRMVEMIRIKREHDEIGNEYVPPPAGITR
jgi:hypothetical protein